MGSLGAYVCIGVSIREEEEGEERSLSRCNLSFIKYEGGERERFS
jgi:hypothetical protein